MNSDEDDTQIEATTNIKTKQTNKTKYNLLF